MRRVSVAGISGSGKTTFSRALAERLGVPWIELDALHHGPNWAAAGAEELRTKVDSAMAAAPDGWVIDGNYQSKLGDFVLERADTVVWLELPLRTSLARLARRTWRRLSRREELWSGNRESIAGFLGPRYGLSSWAVRSYVRHKREVPPALARNAHLRVVHLRSPQEVERFLASV